MAVEATTPTSQLTNSASSSATASLTENYETFLTLLTTQLKNQDPLNPLDSAEFTAQLVQFSSVEQQIQQNKNLETLIAAQSMNAASAAVGYIGRNVAALSDQVGLAGGSASINYALDSNVADTRIIIADQKGKIVRTLIGETGQGAHSVTWDGKDAGGNQLEDGVYTIAVSAANADQTQAGASIGISGLVTGVAMIDGSPVLAIGGVTVPMENVLSVSGESGAGI